MRPLLSWAGWRAVFARTYSPGPSAGYRGVSGSQGYVRNPPVGTCDLQGELDRFGGISVRLARLDALDRLDAAAFQKGLQGKCAWDEGLPGLQSFSNEVTAAPTPESLCAPVSSPEGRGEGTRDLDLFSGAFVLRPFAGRPLRRLGEMVKIPDLGSATLVAGPLSSVGHSEIAVNHHFLLRRPR